MNKLYKIRWINEETDEVGTTTFLAKSEDHAKATFYRFNPDKVGIKGLVQCAQLMANGIYDIHLLNQLHEGDSFRLANEVHDDGECDEAAFWNDEYEVGKIRYTKGPYDPTRHQYQVIDEHGFMYYIKPYEPVIQVWRA